jgi:hypothetical protein
MEIQKHERTFSWALEEPWRARKLAVIEKKLYCFVNKIKYQLYLIPIQASKA